MKKEKCEILWENDIQNWNKVTKDTASLMLSQCETLLKETTETAKSISAKTIIVLSILIPIATSLVVYLITALHKDGITFLTLSALIAIAFICVSIVYSYKNFMQYKIAVPGDFPHEIMRPGFIDESYIGDEQYVNMALSICNSIENRININEKINSKRTRNSRKSLLWLCILPVSPFLSWVVLLLFCHCSCALA
jgi:hypothetical protein